MVVDHVIPHKGNQVLFNDQANWQALCKRCHDMKTASEDGGFGRKTAENDLSNAPNDQEGG